MNKAVIVYVVVLVILLIFGYYLYSNSKLLVHAPKPTVTTKPVSNTSSVKVIPKTNSTKTSKTNTSSVSVSGTSTSKNETSYPLSCLSSKENESIPNGNFSQGYTNWNLTGEGFIGPLNLTYANEKGYYLVAPWTNYGKDNFAATNDRFGMTVAGNITSAPFLVDEPFLNFKIISPENQLIYVEILHNGKPVIIVHYNTYNAAGNKAGPSTFENASIPLSAFLCQNVSIRVVGGYTSTSGTGYIAVTGFYLSKESFNTPGIVVNETIQ